MPSEPMTLFRRWLDEAVAAQVIEPNAMCLSTVSPDGKPSGRFVLLKGLDDRGFVWYTNYQSRKGQELAAAAYPVNGVDGTFSLLMMFLFPVPLSTFSSSVFKYSVGEVLSSHITSSFCENSASSRTTSMLDLLVGRFRTVRPDRGHRRACGRSRKPIIL